MRGGEVGEEGREALADFEGVGHGGIGVLDVVVGRRVGGRWMGCAMSEVKVG